MEGKGSGEGLIRTNTEREFSIIDNPFIIKLGSVREDKGSGKNEGVRQGQYEQCVVDNWG